MVEYPGAPDDEYPGEHRGECDGEHFYEHNSEHNIERDAEAAAGELEENHELPHEWYCELWEQVRQAGASIEVSPDLRPRMLEQAHWIAQQQLTWPRLVLAALVFLFTATALEQRVDTSPLQLNMRESAPGEVRSKSWRAMLEADALTSAALDPSARPQRG